MCSEMLEMMVQPVHMPVVFNIGKRKYMSKKSGGFYAGQKINLKLMGPF